MFLDGHNVEHEHLREPLWQPTAGNEDGESFAKSFLSNAKQEQQRYEQAQYQHTQHS